MEIPVVKLICRLQVAHCDPTRLAAILLLTFIGASNSITKADDLESTIHNAAALNKKMLEAKLPDLIAVEIIGTNVGENGMREQSSKTIVVHDSSYGMVFSLRAFQDKKLLQIDLCNPEYVARIEPLSTRESIASGIVDASFDTGLREARGLGNKFAISILSSRADSAAINRMILDRSLSFLMLQAERFDLAIGEWKKGRAAAELVHETDRSTIDCVRFSKLDPNVFNNVLDSASTLTFRIDRESHLVREYEAETKTIKGLAIVRAFVDVAGVQVPCEMEFHSGESKDYVHQKWKFIDVEQSGYVREHVNLAHFGLADRDSQNVTAGSGWMRGALLGGITLLGLTSLILWYFWSSK